MTDLNDILGEYKDVGFSIREPDDHVLEVFFKDKKIAILNQSKATPEVILKGCSNYIKHLTKQARG